MSMNISIQQSKTISKKAHILHESPFFDAQMKRKTLHIGLIQTLHSFLVTKRPRSRHSEATPVVAFQSEPLTGLVFHLPSPIVSSTGVTGSAIKQPVEKRTCMIEISWKMFGISYQQIIVEFTRYPKRLHQSLCLKESGVSENGANAAKAPFPMGISTVITVTRALGL